MLRVAMYLGDGTFFEPGEYELRASPVGVSHKFILFIRQSGEELNFSAALEEAKRFGFSVVEFSKVGLIQPEALNSMPGFGVFYEEALSTGHSLVWYPNVHRLNNRFERSRVTFFTRIPNYAYS
jgi:hypothetical protein